MSPNVEPSLEEFLAAPTEDVAKVAPTTLIFAAGGTRRSLALAGLPLSEYAQWNRPRMLASYALFFDHGISHLITPLTRPQMFAEEGLYRKRLFQWLQWGVAGAESLAFYRDADWRVKLIVAGEPMPELTEVANVLEQTTGDNNGPTLWYIITPDYDQLWTWQAQAYATGARTRAEAVETLYGTVIPPAAVLISFGKPFVSLDVLPPLLYNEIQCYWTQKPGYAIDEHDLRSILYDYAYLRPTWRQDKTGRAEEALAHRDAWEHGPTIGLGMRLGPFWYPAPISGSYTLLTLLLTTYLHPLLGAAPFFPYPHHCRTVRNHQR
jgi:hypothetical protein